MNAEKRFAPFLEIVGWVFLVIGAIVLLSALSSLGDIMPQACLSEVKSDSAVMGNAIGAALSLFVMFTGLLSVRWARKIKKSDD